MFSPGDVPTSPNTAPGPPGEPRATHPHTRCHWSAGSPGDRGTGRSQPCFYTRLPCSCSGGLHTHPHLQSHTRGRKPMAAPPKDRNLWGGLQKALHEESGPTGASSPYKAAYLGEAGDGASGKQGDSSSLYFVPARQALPASGWASPAVHTMPTLGTVGLSQQSWTKVAKHHYPYGLDLLGHNRKTDEK